MNSPSGRRCRYPLLSALVMLTIHGQCQALMSPQPQHQHQSLSKHQSSLSRLGPIHDEVQYHYRRRKRNILELHLHSHSISGLDGSHSHRSLSNNHPSFLSHVTPSIFSSQHAIHRGVSRHHFSTSSSLNLAQNSGSESATGFGKGDDKNKRSGGSNKNKSPKSKANKGNVDPWPKSKANKGNVAKGTASSSGNNKSVSNANADDRPKQKPKKNSDRAKRPKKRGYKGKKNNKFNNKHRKRKGTKTTTTKTVPHGESILNTDKSSIKTNDENTSLKGFKTEQVIPEKRQRGGDGTSGKDGPANNNDDKENDEPSDAADTGKRVVQLEMIVSKQSAEIQKLRREIADLTKASKVFSNVVDVLREAGLRIEDAEESVVVDEESENEDDDDDMVGSSAGPLQHQAIYDDMEIFGIAPRSVTDAADAAGASMLAAILAGKHRMLVDVRDAELTRDPKLFVEFIELAILPVAAGLEGLDGDDEYVRNRVKIVFPTVKELMSYRRSMALAAPDVVSLSTLGFDPVDERDNLIVVVAPSPDDIAGVMAMEKLLARTDQNYIEPELRITQPVVVLNHHMVPIDMADMGVGKFTVVYHLRLLSVQYMTGDATPEYVAKQGKNKANTVKDVSGGSSESSKTSGVENDSIFFKPIKEEEAGRQTAASSSNKDDDESPKAVSERSDEEDEALEAAMTHAHEIGVHQGVTRAMVIRAYPKPWHVFVDTSPDTDADFEVAATFDGEPTQEDVNYAIVECLEGGENEDEIVAQQMQAALEAGQLNRVSDMLGISPFDIVPEDKTATTDDSSEENTNDDKPYDGNDWDDLYYDDWFSEDSV